MNDRDDVIYEEALHMRASDCDFGQRVKPAALFRDLSEAAGAHAARLGVGFEAMVARGLLWVHARMKLRFYRFPQAGERVTIRTWPRAIERRLLYPRDFELLATDGTRLVAATSAWLIVDAKTHRIVRPGAAKLEVPALEIAPEPDDALGWRDLEAGNGTEILSLNVRAGYSAVDMLGHVNNSRYVEWLCDAFPLAMYETQRMDWLQIAYTHEVLPGEEVVLRATRAVADTSLWTVVGENSANGSRAFEAMVGWRARATDE